MTPLTLNEDDLLEPQAFFEVLKAGTASIGTDTIEAQLEFIQGEVLKAKRLGQDNYLHWLRFNARALLGEIALVHHGYHEFVYKEAVLALIKQLKETKTIKLIELERYQRPIPGHAVDAIDRAKVHKVFDGFLVLFTDLTDNDYKTADEKAYVERNRDPICFGYFKDESTGESYSRIYPVASWQDDHCDLTFDKILNQISIESHGRLSDKKVLIDFVDDAPKPKLTQKAMIWMKKLISR